MATRLPLPSIPLGWKLLRGRALGYQRSEPLPPNYPTLRGAWDLPAGGAVTGAFSLGGSLQGSYLVDSASSHMLVSKIKPCMSKYKQLYCETANGSLNQLSFI